MPGWNWVQSARCPGVMSRDKGQQRPLRSDVNLGGQSAAGAAEGLPWRTASSNRSRRFPYARR